MTADAVRSAVAGDARDEEVVNVARGAGFVAGGRAFSAAVRLVLAVVLARWLGASDYGLYILAMSVAFAASSLASLGLDTAMERFVAVSVRRQDAAELRGALQVGVVGTIASAMTVGALVFVLADVIAEDVFDEPRLESLLVLSAVLTPLIGVATLLFAVLVGFKRLGEGTLANDFVQPISRAVFLVVFALFGMTAYRAGVAFLLSYVAAVAALVWLVFRATLGFVDKVTAATSARGVGAPHRDLRNIAAFSFPFWFAGLLRIVRTRLQPLLLGIVGTTANVGVFSLLSSASMLGRIAILSINKALRPTLAQLYDAGDRNEVRRLYATTTRWTLSINIPLFIVLVLLGESMLAIFGPNFTAGVSALVVLAVAELVNAGTGMCGSVIAMSGYNRLKLVNSVFSMVISVASNLLLIPPFGVMGAAVAVLVTHASINLIRVVEIWILMRILPWDRHVWKPLLAGGVSMAATGVVLQALPDVLNPGLVAVVSVGVGLVFVGVLAVLGFEPDDQLILRRAWSRIRRHPRPDR